VTVMELLTVKEVAQVLRLSEEAVRRLLRSKQLRGYTVQNSWRIRQEDVEEFLERQSNMNQDENTQTK
jgi:excisionase family DNA binding protein